MQVRNLIVLVGCQLISATSTISLVTLGGIIGTSMTSNKALVTLPLSLMVVAVASTAIPATVLMRRVGRRRGFMLASSVASLGMFVGVIALKQSSFVLFCVATMMLGVNTAFTQQYRFAAAESVEPAQAPRAISYFLLGPIGGALVGPELVKYGQFAVPSIEYLGTLIALVFLYLIQSTLFRTLEPLRGEGPEVPTSNGRPVGEIVRQPLFLVALLGGATAYGVMTFMMTATPLSMHVHDGFDLAETSQVIRSHVLGMYVPSLFAGHLIQRFGVIRMMAVGAVALVAACLIGLQGQSYMHYWYALVMLGIGWNFLYVGSTAMVTLTYDINERFRAQAVNEFGIFGTSAAASLLAGTIIHLYGWYTLVVVPLPLLAISLGSLFLVRKDGLIARSQPASA